MWEGSVHSNALDLVTNISNLVTGDHPHPMARVAGFGLGGLVAMTTVTRGIDWAQAVVDPDADTIRDAVITSTMSNAIGYMSAKFSRRGSEIDMTDAKWSILGWFAPKIDRLAASGVNRLVSAPLFDVID